MLLLMRVLFGLFLSGSFARCYPIFSSPSALRCQEFYLTVENHGLDAGGPAEIWKYFIGGELTPLLSLLFTQRCEPACALAVGLPLIEEVKDCVLLCVLGSSCALLLARSEMWKKLNDSFDIIALLTPMLNSLTCFRM